MRWEQIEHLPSVLLRTWMLQVQALLPNSQQWHTAKFWWVLIMCSSSHGRKLAYRLISAPQQWHLQQALGRPQCSHVVWAP